MISGNQTWQQALLQPAKQALFVLEIPDFGMILAGFAPSQVNVALGGYGITLYGSDGYGT